MQLPHKTVRCEYHYDALDRLTSQIQTGTPLHHRFYSDGRLVTEIQGAVRYSIFQQEDLPMAQQRSDVDVFNSSLLATDQQRSVLHTFEANQRHAIAYSPYGYRPAENKLLHSLGFNGERPDTVTGHYLLGNGYRAFNPVLMRFNSPDSMSPFGKGGLNPYAYCMGDPINYYDPSGNISISRFLSSAFKWVKKSFGIKTKSSVSTSSTHTSPNTRFRPRSNSAPSLAEKPPSTEDLKNWDLIGFHGSLEQHTKSLISGLDPKHIGSGAGTRLGRGFYLSPQSRLPQEYAKRRVLFGSSAPKLFGVYTKNLNRLKAGPDFTFSGSPKLPIERRFLEIVIRERAYNTVVIRAADLRRGVVLPKSYEAPF